MAKSKKSDNSSNGIKKCWEYVKKFWDYIWNDDSLMSYLLNFAVAFIFIKYLFFPALGFVLNNDYPVVAIVSGSMEHKVVQNFGKYEVCDKTFIDSSMKGRLDTEEWWKYCGDYYEREFNLSYDNFTNYPYQNGLNIGDVMILYGEEPEDIEVGEVLVFVPNDRQFFVEKGPVIHRVIQKWEGTDGKFHFRTKGDHNSESFNNFEEDIIEDQVIAVAKIRIPFIGYAKVWLNEGIIFVGGLVR